MKAPEQATQSATPSRVKTLSKSDFKLARTCVAKLYFRENGYPDNRVLDPYMALLAEGGYMVEALAKARYPDGIALEHGNDLAAEARITRQHLERDQVTLFEATLLVGRQQARVDAIEKRGNLVRLIEMKSKSFDGAEHQASKADGGLGVFRSTRKPFGVLAEWREKLEDVTYQVLLLEKALPGVEVRPYLALVDKSKRAEIDGIPNLFELIRRIGQDGSSRLYTARYVGDHDQLVSLDLVTEVDVSAEVALLRDEVGEVAGWFESRLDAPLSEYKKGLERGSKCVKCEFRHNEVVQKNGFHDCWGPLATAKPHMLELFSIGKAHAPDRTALVEWMVQSGTASLLDIPVEGLVTAAGEVGKEAARQRRQIAQTRTGTPFVGPSLRTNIEALRGPLHFIDFETSGLALPYHAKMKPYGVVTFQWSCHTVPKSGDQPLHSEWLNSVDLWPNQTFAESLRNQIGDKGSVLAWSPFEKTKLRQMVEDLSAFGRDEPELVQWMCDIGPRIVDLHEWARDEFYHPGMGGRTGIKYVLDALWRDDPAMRRQFTEWTGLTANASTDPYSSLLPVQIDGVRRAVREGTGAMRAYEAMMYGSDKDDAAVKASWASLLKQYCQLDTLSMVLIFEHWRRVTGLA